jgi:subtilisin family serine protease
MNLVNSAIKLALSLFILAAPLGSAVTGGETRARIAILDTGLNVTPEIAPYLCRDGHAAFVSRDLSDPIGHGTAVAEIVAARINPERACITIIKWYDPGTPFHPDHMLKSYMHALKIGARVVNLSAGGAYASEDEYAAIKQLLEAGIEFVVAAGNSSQDFNKACTEYPACYNFSRFKNFTVVGALHGENVADYSNYGGIIKKYRSGDYPKAGMQGTSFAAPIVAGEILAQLTHVVKFNPYAVPAREKSPPLLPRMRLFR